MTEINVLSDGNCLFRCIASFLDNKFEIADRFKNGRIKARKLDEYETENARALRIVTIESMKAQKEKYSNDIIYNDTELYETIDVRIRNMSNHNELAGLLELKILSKILKMNFNIYVKHIDHEYNLVARVGKKYTKRCHLLLDDDHYKLIIWS
jgi:hypothetical protein